MKKRIFLFLVFAVLLGGGVFAQNNWVSAEVSILGAGIRYERVLNPNLTLGVNVYSNFLPTPFIDSNWSTDHTVSGGSISTRWYPTGRKFFFELNLGSASFDNRRLVEDWNENEDEVSEIFSGFAITPGFGWTVDVGKAGGFFLSPGAKIPIIFTGDDRDVMGVGLGELILTGVFYMGLGYAF